MNKNLFINYGSTYKKSLFAKNDNGSVYTLDSKSVKLVISKHIQSATKFIFNIDIFNPLTGEISINLTTNDTKTLPKGELVYNIFAIDQDQQVFLLFTGNVSVNASLYTPELFADIIPSIPNFIDGGSAQSTYVSGTSLADGGLASTIFNQQLIDGGSAFV